jgi:hypothetical protein
VAERRSGLELLRPAAVPKCLENHVQQGTVDFDPAVVVNKTQSFRIARWASCGNLADIPQMTPKLA